MKELAQWEFDIFALSLPRGLGFGDRPPVGAWRSDDGVACGALTRDVSDGSFGLLVMRRRVDFVWIVPKREHGFSSNAEALALLELYLVSGGAPEPIPPGVPRRPALHDLQGRTPSDVFKLLASRSHHPAAWVLNQLYVALPKPDQNWVSDCQTGNFHTRLADLLVERCFAE